MDTRKSWRRDPREGSATKGIRGKAGNVRNSGVINSVASGWSTLGTKGDDNDRRVALSTVGRPDAVQIRGPVRSSADFSRLDPAPFFIC